MTKIIKIQIDIYFIPSHVKPCATVRNAMAEKPKKKVRQNHENFFDKSSGLEFNAQVRAWGELPLFAVKVATIGWP